MKQENKTEVIHIRIDKVTKDRLQQLADNDRRTVSDFIRIELEKLVENKPKKKAVR